MSKTQSCWPQVHVTAILGTGWAMLRNQIKYATSQVKDGGISSHTCNSHVIRNRRSMRHIIGSGWFLTVHLPAWY
jgi:hypothetical protein